jgi:hypothetical protein
MASPSQVQLAAMLALLLAGPALAQDHDHGSPATKLVRVGLDVLQRHRQPLFNRAVALSLLSSDWR